MNTKKKIIIIVIALLAGVGGGTGYHLYHSANAGTSSEDIQRQTDQLVATVGKLVVLPDERPVVATVEDPSKLQNQPLFKNAKKGDKVLLYQNARKAILYDPTQNRIVEIAPLTLPPTPTMTPH